MVNFEELFNGVKKAGIEQILAISVFSIIVLNSFRLSAQFTQPAQYERPQKGSDHEYVVISMSDNGLALVRDIDKFENNKKKWEVIFIDSTLNESWTTNIEVDQRMSMLGHDYHDGNIYLIFQEIENTGRKINLTEIRVSDKLVKQHEFKPDVNLRYTQFIALKNKAVFGGYLMKEPTILMYDLINESTKVLPGTFVRKTELMDVRNNTNGTFNVVLAERDAKPNSKLVVRTYDTNGILLADDVIAIDEGKTVGEAITSSLVHDELVVMGTWNYGTGKQSAGIFSVIVDPFTEQTVNYYDFAEFNHFLDYLKPKKAAKVRAKAEWRKSVGKWPEFRTYLYPVKIEESKTGYTLLAEVFEPPTNYYNLRPNSPYGYSPNNYYTPYGYSPYTLNSSPYRYNNSPYGYPYSSNYANYNDTRIVHSALLFFDDHGKLISDQALKFPEIKLSAKEQVSDFINLGNRTVMVCKLEKEIITQINDSDGTIIQEEKIKPLLKNSKETVKSESQENGFIRFWFGRYFFVYGYHAIKDEAEKNSRDVFYINKIRVD